MYNELELTALETIAALAGGFSSVCYVVRKNGDVRFVRRQHLEDELYNRMIEHSHLKEMMHEYVNAVVVSEDAAEMEKFGDLEYVENILRSQDQILHTYRRKKGEETLYFRLLIVPSADGNGLVYGYLNIDFLVREQQAKIAMEKQQNALLRGLSMEYATVWYIDADAKTVKLIRNNRPQTPIAEQTIDAQSGNYDEMMHWFVDSFVAPEDKEKLRQQLSLESLMENTKPDDVLKITFGLIDPEQKKYYLQACVSRVEEEGTRFVCGFRDVNILISEELKKQQELVEAKAAAEAANEAKSNFLFNMSHDIRTPLNAIMGFTELAGMYPDNIGKTEEYRKKVLTASRQMLSILNNVLEMARIESKKLRIETELTDSREFFDSVITMFNSDLYRKNMKLMTDTDLKHNYLYLDRPHVTEILMNILSNAIKYTPDGGSIYFTIQEYEGSSQNECIVETKIRDTGLGMSSEFLAEIYDQFSRERTSAKNEIQGTGLGMAIVKRLVEKMNGTIRITSEVGVGTEVTLRIPHRIGQASTKKLTPMDEAAKNIDFNGKRILLAEDLEVNALLATEILKMRGFEVEHAVDGAECVKMLMNSKAGYYDLILMDVQMPNLNGYEAALKIRGLRDHVKAQIPIIAMTANAFEDDRRKAYISGMNAHVAKPFEMEKLFATIANVMTKEKYYIDSPALEEFKERYETYGCPCGYFVYQDDESEQILYADSKTVDIFGCSSADEFIDLVKGSFKTLVHPDDLMETEKEIVRQQTESKEGLDYITYRIRRKDGRVRSVKDIGYKVFNGDGYVYYVHIVDVTDLTEKE